MIRISFDDDNKIKGRFSLMKLAPPKFLSVEREGNTFIVNEAASQALKEEGIGFNTISEMSFCCHDFYNFYMMNHIGKPSLPAALFPDKLYYLFTTKEGMRYPEGSPIIYCSWCGKQIEYSGF